MSQLLERQAAPAGAVEEPVVEIRGLTRRFGSRVALDAVDLTIPRGTVMGLVGENGAGKTTLIRHLLGLLRAQQGSVRVFGRDPVTDPEGVLSRIGYLQEDADLPGWMRVGELMRYTRAFYPTWDDCLAERLRQEFGLDAGAAIRTLSKGQRARAGLMAALAYRPELLVLDEPSSGLDPIARRDILTAIIRSVADEGRTVLFSSHLLSEVERVADSIAMVRHGRILFCAPLDEVQEVHCRVTLRFPEPRPTAPALASALRWDGSGREWTAICRCGIAPAEAEAALLGGRVVHHDQPSLDEIFVAYSAAPSYAEAPS
ncbi:MAG: ABC transporter ATP-binding protein [Armatimonadota bacterium]